MEKKTMGAFMAALRKAGGMTQQEVADRLNVSNKTISKWERNEGYPEITILPALAELFDVTSDEILRGERLTPPEGDGMKVKQAARVEKQIRRIVSSSMTRFQNFSCLAAALALAGLICLFTTAYAFYRPVLAFGIMLIFVIASMTMELFLINTCRASAADPEITGDHKIILDPLRRTVNRCSFTVFMIDLAVIVLALPFVLVRDGYFTESVISAQSYISVLPTLILIIALLCIFLLNLFREKLHLGRGGAPGVIYPARKMMQMNLVQGVALAAAIILALLGGIYLEEMSFPSYLCIGCVFVLLALIVASMIVLAAKAEDRPGRYLLLAAGLRNCLYAAAVIYMLQGLTIVYPAYGQREIFFAPKPAAFALWAFLGATAFYFLVKRLIYRGDQTRGRF